MSTQGEVRWIKAFVGLQLPDGDEWLVDNRGRPIKGLDLDMAESGAVIAEAADVAAIAKALRFVTCQRAYWDQLGNDTAESLAVSAADAAITDDDLARLAALIERARTGEG